MIVRNKAGVWHWRGNFFKGKISEIVMISGGGERYDKRQRGGRIAVHSATREDTLAGASGPLRHSPFSLFNALAYEVGR